ncbi:hypothetical protein KCP76_03515 [Salmonella enterica subsp. enterica serovar Weltevreden]|nr:hypothetical protein KCP76_03515 [Salmonella enterica subsp. enterica serovar Weltevreden]
MSASSRLSTRVLAWKTVLSRLRVRLSGWTWKMSFHYDNGNRILNEDLVFHSRR